MFDVEKVLIFGLLLLASQTSFSEVREGQFLSGVKLYSDEAFSPSALHSCQPSVGDKTLIVNIVARVEALKGLNGAKVKITSGKCVGETGFVAIAHLNSLV